MGLNLRTQSGVSLIELIIAIVVLGIAVVGVLTALGRTTLLQVDPLIRAQSLALAESFMDEVTGKPFYNPDADPRFDDGASPPIDPCADMPELSDLSGSNRLDLLNSACAYNGYNADTHEGGVMAPDGTIIPGLGAYNVRIEIGNSGLETPFSSAPANCILRITVTVDDATGTPTRLQAYRTSGWEECA
ncbi:MAG: prepilin-type N-terminal cleavage/methylation domain-containing protein [Natronospirillum sp.]|uniref:type IV pilus modification PilV family protein n=1 Tax=Natronospirillum sp. TaxID=2812955 RepID=UPI0025D85551|nr:prepilin-type N-terminal cleavage/methylation domain-containing protein [Natronospirillum sp.]MCH8550812.1 prepilin-type N-terminal cleavage/methylation domain-containing protein [Natronospirillum sp.]